MDVYNLAADMGGMGFIENNKALCMLSVLINTHLLHGRAATHGVERFFYSSSACVYAADKQTDADVTAAEGERRLPGDARGRLRLGEAVQRADVPALPRGLRPARRASPATTTSTARTAPGTAAARRRRPRSAARSPRPSCHGKHEIEIWGDGEQTRSFMYIDDCVKGTADDHATATSTSRSTSAASELVTINQLVDIVEEIAGVKLKRRYNLDAPKGVRGRNSDNTHDPRAARLGALHQPADGLEQTYAWIYDQVAALTAMR